MEGFIDNGAYSGTEETKSTGYTNQKIFELMDAVKRDIEENWGKVCIDEFENMTPEMANRQMYREGE